MAQLVELSPPLGIVLPVARATSTRTPRGWPPSVHSAPWAGGPERFSTAPCCPTRAVAPHLPWASSAPPHSSPDVPPARSNAPRQSPPEAPSAPPRARPSPPMAHIHVEALQQLSQHLALGLDEPLMQFTFHALEHFIAKRPGSKSINVLAQPCERTRCSLVVVGAHRRDMKYWHWGSPPQWFLFRTKHRCRGPLPRLPSFRNALADKVSPTCLPSKSSKTIKLTKSVSYREILRSIRDQHP